MVKILLVLGILALVIYFFPTLPLINLLVVLSIPIIAFLFVGATKP